jgi:hypothetical protein
MPTFYYDYDDINAKYERYRYVLKNKDDGLPYEDVQI